MMHFVKNGLADKIFDDFNISVSGSGMGSADTIWHGENVIAHQNCLYFITEGECGWLSDKFGKVNMKKDHVYLIPYGHTLSYGTDGEYKKVFFHISFMKKDGFDLFDSFGRIGELYAPELVSSVEENYLKNDILSAVRVKTALLETFLGMAEKYEYKVIGNMDHSPLIRAAIKYINENISASLTCEMIAEHLHVSRVTVWRSFSGELGMSVGQYVNKTVMIEARKRLMAGDDSIGKISHDLGYSDQFYFSRCFKSFHGYSPSEFRKNTLEGNHMRIM